MSPSPRGGNAPPPPPLGGGGGGGGGVNPVSLMRYLLPFGSAESYACDRPHPRTSRGRRPTAAVSQPSGSSGTPQPGSGRHLLQSRSNGGSPDSTCSTARSPQRCNHSSLSAVNDPRRIASASSSS